MLSLYDDAVVTALNRGIAAESPHLSGIHRYLPIVSAEKSMVNTVNSSITKRFSNIDLNNYTH